MEAIPRISRAQSMDALSSQATVAGYRAVLIAAQEQGRFFPMLMTAAGTIPPAQVLVLGAGVAGLQAIATSRRLGAVVTAFDVRAAVKEQVQSLGAKFLEVEGSADAEAAGGYARELTEEEQQAQRDALAEQIAPLRRRDHHRARPRPAGAEAGHRRRRERDEARQRDRRPRGRGGRQLRADEAGRDVRDRQGVTIASPLNLPSSMAEHASQLYARNVVSLLELMTGEEGALTLDFDDAIIAGACITRGGEIVHEAAKKAAEEG